MIGNEMLFKLLVDEKYGLRLLKVLMIGRYNLNGPRNIVLLPQKEEVGSIIRWPIHPNNHPGFDEYAEQKITDLKMRLMKALGNKKLHEIKPDNVSNIAEDVNKVSDLLFQILEQMPGGVHINKIKEYGAAIEKRLAKKRK
jgi:hypothetical protein